MTNADLPPGEPFHTIDVTACLYPEGHGNPFRYCACGWMEEPPPQRGYYAHVTVKDLDDGVKYATRRVLDRARTAGHNPRKGYVTVFFDDNGVGARWDPKEDS